MVELIFFQLPQWDSHTSYSTLRMVAVKDFQLPQWDSGTHEHRHRHRSAGFQLPQWDSRMRISCIRSRSPILSTPSMGFRGRKRNRGSPKRRFQLPQWDSRDLLRNWLREKELSTPSMGFRDHELLAEEGPEPPFNSLNGIRLHGKCTLYV